jgi:predicted nucleic acid-binding protein
MSRFLDTSAAVKIYHEEEHSDEMVELYDSEVVLMLSELAIVEFHSAGLRKFREEEIDEEALVKVNDRFLRDLADRYQLMDFCPAVTDEAVRLLNIQGKRHALRTLDAFQLGFFLTYCDKEDRFLTYDQPLSAVAEELGICLE